jgi:hypothetical protein
MVGGRLIRCSEPTRMHEGVKANRLGSPTSTGGSEQISSNSLRVGPNRVTVSRFWGRADSREGTDRAYEYERRNEPIFHIPSSRVSSGFAGRSFLCCLIFAVTSLARLNSANVGLLLRFNSSSISVGADR